MAGNRWKDRADALAMLPIVSRWMSARRAKLLTVALARRLWPMITKENMQKVQEFGKHLDPDIHDFDPAVCQQLILLVEKSADQEVDQSQIRALADTAKRLGQIANYYFECYVSSWGEADFPTLALCQAAEAVFNISLHYHHALERLANAAARARFYEKQTPVVLEYVGPEEPIDEGHLRACDAHGEDPDELADQANTIRDLCPLEKKFPAFDKKFQSQTVVNLAQEIYDNHVFENMPVLADALIDAGCDDATIIEHCHSSNPHYRGCWVIDGILGLK